MITRRERRVPALRRILRVGHRRPGRGRPRRRPARLPHRRQRCRRTTRTTPTCRISWFAGPQLRACCSMPSGKRRMRSDYLLSQLDVLEAESIHIMREVAAEFERPALLFSGGKDSIVMLALAEKAFRPANIPFPVMHIDTGHNFPEVIDFRDRRAAELGVRLVVASVQESIDAGPRDRGDRPLGQQEPAADRDPARRDRGEPLRRAVRRRPPRRGEGAGQGAGLLLPRRVRPVGPEEPAPRAVEPLQRADQARRAHPGVPAVQLDRARHLGLHRAGEPGDPVHLLRARAAGVRARRHPAGRQRVPDQDRGRAAVHRDRAVPDGRRHDDHRRGRVERRHRRAR